MPSSSARATTGSSAPPYLARAGMRTLLVEARTSVGGTASSDTFAGATVNICNCDHITFRTTPVMDELRLGDHGLRYLDVDPAQTNMAWSGGPAWAMHHDVDATLDSLATTFPRRSAATADISGRRCRRCRWCSTRRTTRRRSLGSCAR
ncbi:MAG: hypothetical protein R2713_22290 [Ilumatobacteraceae bacterium]